MVLRQKEYLYCIGRGVENLLDGTRCMVVQRSYSIVPKMGSVWKEGKERKGLVGFEK